MSIVSYYKEATNWADDTFHRVQATKVRYQLAFLLAMALNLLCVLAITILSSTQTLVPFVVHHYDNGVTTVEKAKNNTTPVNEHQIKSDLARFIENREAYDSSSYRHQFELIQLLANDEVANAYRQEQRKDAPHSPITVLGDKFQRSVHIYSIQFLDSFLANEKDLRKNHHNLAEVLFSLTDTNKETGQATETCYNALISWRYMAPSDNPEERLQNWDGLEVTRYNKTVRG